MNQDKSTIFEKNILLYMEEAENIYQNTEHTMMDKLGERIFFERMSIRLYEGLIRKHRGDVFKSRLPDMNRIKQFHDEEKEHFQLLEKTIKQMGGDPSIMTSAAELIASSRTSRNRFSISCSRSAWVPLLRMMRRISEAAVQNNRSALFRPSAIKSGSVRRDPGQDPGGPHVLRRQTDAFPA